SVRGGAAARAAGVPGRSRTPGGGIAPADLPNVFDRFWQGRRSAEIRSTGLGLAIARGIIEAHGGRIVARSALGRGSTFSFDLPASPSEPSPPRPAVARNGGS